MYGDYDKAKPIFQRVLQMDPFNDDAQDQLAFIG
jgi:DNA-binding SARP family transcriptional activator